MIDIHGATEPLPHFWSTCVGAGRAAEGLRAGWLEHLALAARTAGFRYLRFHGLLHDDMFVYRSREDGPVYNFQYIDELFDRMLDLDVRPFVEFGFSPRDLATDTETVFWWKGHGSMPRNLDTWSALITALCEHWIQRYGLDEVRSWYFEVWNEPNLHPFFTGGKAAYFALYESTVRAVKAVDDALRVGGPATSNFVPDARFARDTEDLSEHALVRDAAAAGTLDDLDWQPVWVAEFLEWCAGRGLPVDFVSAHPYPTDWPLDEHGAGLRLTRGRDATITDLTTLRALIGRSSYPAAEIHLTEWSSSSSSRDFTHDFPHAATFVVRSILGSIGLTDSLSYWTFTDVFEEGGAGDAAFHGGFGMITYQGVPKPTLAGYQFLHRLGDEVIDRTSDSITTRHSDSGRVTALYLNYPAEVTTAVAASWDTPATAERELALGSPEARRLEWSGVPAGAEFAIERLDPEHGHVFGAWQGMGSPGSPSRAQVALLTTVAEDRGTDSLRADARGVLEAEITIPAWGIVLVDEVRRR